MSIAAVLIVKNEQDHLPACLESLAWVDEIVVVDAGSTDRTREVAREFTDRVVMKDDWQGFGVQRQRAEALVESDWILMVDADERVTPELRESLQAAVARDTLAIDTLPRPAPLSREVGPLCPGLGRAAGRAGEARQPRRRHRARYRLLPAHVPAQGGVSRWPPGTAAGAAFGPLHLRQVRRSLGQDPDRPSTGRWRSRPLIASAAAVISMLAMSRSPAPEGGQKARRCSARLQVCQRRGVAERCAG